MDAALPSAYGLEVRFLLLIAALCLPAAAHAEGGALGPSEGKTAEEPDDDRYVYVYVDRDGQLHFVDRMDLVPATYRDRARKTSLVTSSGDHNDAVSKSAMARRDARLKRAREAQEEERVARAAAAKEAAQRAEGAEPEAEDRPPTRAERLADALTERRQVLMELVALEEGWAEDAEQDEVTLATRVDHLDRRLAELDAAVAELQPTR